MKFGREDQSKLNSMNQECIGKTNFKNTQMRKIFQDIEQILNMKSFRANIYQL